MPDKKDLIAKFNKAKAEGKVQVVYDGSAAAAPATSGGSLIDKFNKAQSEGKVQVIDGADPATTQPDATATPGVYTPAAIDQLPVVTGETDAQGRPVTKRPHSMQKSQGLADDVIETNFEHANRVFNKLTGNTYNKPLTDNVVVAPPSKEGKVNVYGLKGGEAMIGHTTVEAISAEEKKMMQDTYKRELDGVKNFIVMDYQNNKDALAKYWVGGDSSAPMRIESQEAKTIVSEDHIANRLANVDKDPTVLKDYVSARGALLRDQHKAELEAAKAKYIPQGIVEKPSRTIESPIFGTVVESGNTFAEKNIIDQYRFENPELQSEIKAINEKYADLNKNLISGTTALAYMKTVNSAMKAGKPLSPREIGIAVKKVMGDDQDMERLERLERKGIAAPPAVNVENEIVGYRAMQYAARAAAANGQDSVAQTLNDTSANYMEKVRANNPGFVRQQKVAAIREKIEAENSNAIRTGLIGYSPSQKDIEETARRHNIDPTGITPEDIGDISPLAARALSAFVQNSAGGIFTSGMRVAGKIADAVSPGSVDWDKFNEHYNENWYDNTFIGNTLKGKLTQPTYQLFGQESVVDTEAGEGYLMNKRNPKGGDFTWNVGAITNQMADGLGMIAAFGAVGGGVGTAARATGVLGTAAEGTAAAGTILNRADRIGSALTVGLTQYNSSYNEALAAIGDDPTKETDRNAYAMVRMLSAAATEMILPDAKIARDILSPTSMAGRELIDQIQSGGIRALENGTAGKLFVKAIKEGAKDWAKETSEDVLDNMGTWLDDLMFAPKKAAETEYGAEMKQTLITSAISSFLPTTTGGARRAFGQGKLTQNLMYTVGENPEEYIAEIKSQMDDGILSKIEGNDKIKVINTLSQAVAATPTEKPSDGKPMSRADRVAYANNMAQQALLEEQKAKTTDDVIKDQLDQQLADLRAQRAQILAPAPAAPAAPSPAPEATPPPTVTPPAPAPETTQPTTPETTSEAPAPTVQPETVAPAPIQEVTPPVTEQPTIQPAAPQAPEAQQPTGLPANAVDSRFGFVADEDEQPAANATISTSPSPDVNAPAAETASITSNTPTNAPQESSVEVQEGREPGSVGQYQGTEGEGNQAPLPGADRGDSNIGGQGQQGQVQAQAGPVSQAIIDKFQQAPRTEGLPFTRTLADGSQLPGKYVLTTAEAVTPSHNPATFGTTQGFPTLEDGRNPNDRDYTLPENSQRVQGRAANFDGRAVENVPTVDANGVVIDGNDRTMAGQLAAQQGTDAAYIAALRANAQVFGFTPQQVDDMIAQGLHPRVVFQTDEVQPYTTDTFARFNPRTAGKAKSDYEESVTMGRTVGDPVIRVVADEMSRFPTLSDFYNSPTASKTVKDALVTAGVITTDELPRYYNSQRQAFTEDGKRVLQNLMLGRVFDETGLTILNNNPSLRQKVLLAIKNLITIEANPAFALRQPLADALLLKQRVDAYMAETGIKDKQQGIAAFMQQLDMFEAKPTPVAVAIWNVLEAPQTKSLVEFTNNMLAQAEQQKNGTGPDLFGEKAPMRDAIIEKLLGVIPQEQQTQDATATELPAATEDGAAVDEQPEPGGYVPPIQQAEQAEPAQPVEEVQPESGRVDEVPIVEKPARQPKPRKEPSKRELAKQEAQRRADIEEMLNTRPDYASAGWVSGDEIIFEGKSLTEYLIENGFNKDEALHIHRAVQNFFPANAVKIDPKWIGYNPEDIADFLDAVTDVNLMAEGDTARFKKEAAERIEFYLSNLTRGATDEDRAFGDTQKAYDLLSKLGDLAKDDKLYKVNISGLIEEVAPAPGSVEQIETTSDGAGNPVVQPEPEKPVVLSPANGRPVPTGDIKQDAINEHAWRQSVLDKKLARIAVMEREIADETDALDFALKAMGAETSTTSKVYISNKRVADSARARIDALKKDISSSAMRALLQNARDEVAKAKAAMEEAINGAPKQPVTEEQTPFEQAKAAKELAEADIARLTARLDSMEEDRIANSPMWTPDQFKAYKDELKGLKAELGASRKAKREASAEVTRLKAKSGAKTIRSKKGDDNIVTANLFGISPKLANEVIELVAKAYEAGGSLAASIQQGVDYIKDRWFTPWNEAKFREAMGENRLIPITPDEMRSQMDAGFPLSKTNEAAARNMVDAIKANTMSLSEAMDYIAALPRVSDGTKANIRKYVKDYVRDEITKPNSEALAAQHLQQNNNDYDAAINSLLNERAALQNSTLSQQERENREAEYIQALTDLQTDQATAKILDGTILPQYDRSIQEEDSIFPNRQYGPLLVGSGRKTRLNRENLEVAKRKVGERFQNRFRTAEEVVARSKEPVTEDTNFSDAFHLKQSRADAEKQDMQDKIGYVTAGEGTLLGDMHKDGISASELDLFMMAQHAEERNEYNAKVRRSAFNRRLHNLNMALKDAKDPITQADVQDQINDLLSNTPKRPENKGFVLMPDGGIGMTNQEAKDELDKVEQMGKTALYEQYAERFRTEVIDHTLDILYDNDLITAEKYNQLRRNSAGTSHYKFYVPSRVSDDFFLEDENRNAGKPKPTGVSAIIFRSRGAADIKTKDRVSPIQQSLDDLEAAIQAKWDNKAGYIMGNFIKQNPDPAWSVVPARYKTILGEQDEIIAQVPEGKPANVVYEFKKDGKTQYIVSTNPGIKNMFAVAPGEAIASWLNFIPRWFSGVRTRYSPEFIVKNPWIDGWDASFALASQDDKRYVANYRKIGIKGQYKIFKALNGEQNEYTEWVKNAKERGGLITFFNSTKKKEGADKVLKLFESLDSKNPLSFANRRRMAKAWGGFSDSLEEMTRARVYIAAVETGIQQLMDGGMDRAEAEQKVDRNKAALISRNATIDFGKRGVYGQWLNVWKTFANAATLGAANNMYMATKKGPGGDRARGRLAFMVFLGMSFAEMARAAGDCDDPVNQNADCWDEISEYDKAKNLMIPWFLVAGKGAGYLKIPLGRVGYGTFNYIGNKISDAIHGKTSVGNFTASILSAMGDTYNPSGSEVWPMNVFGNFSLPFAMAFNKNPMHGRTLYPEKDNTLRSQSYTKKTPNAYIELADKWHKATGGGPGKESNLKWGDEGINWGEISPNQMEFFMQTMGGGVYNILQESATTIKKATDDIEGNVEPSHIPFVGIMAPTNSMPMTQGKYYRLVERSEKNLLSEEEWKEALDLSMDLQLGDKFTAEQRGRSIGYIKSNQQRVRSGIKKAGGEVPPATNSSTPSTGSVPLSGEGVVPE